jgi:predicted ATPase/DNA-binding SARP family transcriptional activator
LPKVKPILAYLLLNKEASVQREALAFRMWPDVTEKKAKERLRRHLYNLRGALPPDEDKQPWLLINAKTVQWNPAAPYWLDVAAFEHLSQQSNRFAEALALYSGALLPDFDEGWLLPLRQRLQSIFEQVLSQLVHQSWQAEDFRQALRYCEQLLAEDGFNEEVVRQKLALHYALGNRGVAVASYQRFSQLLAEELAVDALPETEAVFVAIQQNKPVEQVFGQVGFLKGQAQVASPHNIPAPLRVLVGRGQERQQLIEMITGERPARLLTLTGTGGIGKTRLAVAVGQAIAEGYGHRFPDGVFFVSLAAVREPEMVFTAVAEVLSIQVRDDDFEAVREHLRYQACLLILDNFEHLLAGIGQLHELLQTASELQFLVTSRTPLNLYGERAYPVAALGLPVVEGLEQGLSYPISELEVVESVAFFTAVARSVNPRFELTAENGTAVARICTLLDGIPLAIELAAARSKHFPPDVLFRQLSRDLSLLVSQAGAEDVPERHRTIEASLQWSFDLLSEREKGLFVGLSLFEDGFSVSAVSCAFLDKPFVGISDLDAETVNLLTSLADKNLIHLAAQNRVDGELRFAMLIVVRSFAYEKLGAVEAARLKIRLLQYFGEWYEPMWESVGKPDAAVWTHHFQVEYKSLMTMVDYGLSLSDPAVEVVEAMGRIVCFYKRWEASGNMKTALAITAWVLVHQTVLPTKILQRIYFSGASLAAATGDYELATAYINAYYQQADLLADYAAMVASLELASTIYNRQENPEKALTVLQEAAALLDDDEKEIKRRDYLRAGIHSNMGVTFYFLGDYVEAERFLLLQLAYDVAQDDLPNIGHGAINLGEVAMMVGAYDKAAGYYRQSLAAREQAREWAGVMQCVSAFAGLALARAEFSRYVTLQGAAMSWNQQQGYQSPPFELREKQEKLDQCRKELGDQAYQGAWRNGRNLTLEQAVTLALA